MNTPSRRYSVTKTMPFVKLDTGILDSTLWMEREQREVFITSLLLAEPVEITSPMPAIKIRAIEDDGFVVPVGWYGFVRAASVGIIRRAGVDKESGMKALEDLASPDKHSRSSEFDGRRMVRVDGGFIILNYMKYRDRDYTAAERQRRLRERRKLMAVTRDGANVTRDSNVTSRIAEAYSREQIAEADKSNTTPVRQSRKLHFSLPSLGEVTAYCQERKNNVDPQQWFDYYTANGWKVGKNSMKDWRATIRTWERNGFNSGAQHGISKTAVQLREERNRETLRRSLSQIDDYADESKPLFKRTD